MTKVYLVIGQGCGPTGCLDVQTPKTIYEVFTKKKLADKCAEYYNQEWHLGFQRNADFKADRIKFYYVQTMVVNHNDFSKLPF